MTLWSTSDWSFLGAWFLLAFAGLLIVQAVSWLRSRRHHPAVVSKPHMTLQKHTEEGLHYWDQERHCWVARNVVRDADGTDHWVPYDWQERDPGLRKQA